MGNAPVVITVAIEKENERVQNIRSNEKLRNGE